MTVAAKKIATIVRSINRAREEHGKAAGSFRSDLGRQDAAVLNVMRACEAAVDLANMLVRERRLGLPSNMRVAVHDYQALNLDVVEAVITKNLDDLLTFAETVRPHLAGDD